MEKGAGTTGSEEKEKMKSIIILYGGFGTQKNVKQQAMIDGRSTCMYREYARAFGEIIYLAPQYVSLEWEKCIINPVKLFEYLKTKPECIIWSVKDDKKKDEILVQLKNKKIYYSCCAYNTTNKYCTISLVDIRQRIKGNAVLWFKGKDHNYWYPESKKKYDYILVGRRNDKNESYFINRLTKEVKEKRSVLWVAGKEHFVSIEKTHHDITLTTFLPMKGTKCLLSSGKIGILLSEHPAEGFPQTFLELTMCGVPVLYLDRAPYNSHYFGGANSVITDKQNCIVNAEKMLSGWREETPVACRDFAISRYSLKESYKNILRML